MTNFSHFTQLGNSFSRFTIKKHEQKRVQCLVKHLKRNFIIDVWQGSEHASEEHLLRLVFLVNSAHLLRHRKLERKYWENFLPCFWHCRLFLVLCCLVNTWAEFYCYESIVLPSGLKMNVFSIRNISSNLLSLQRQQ